ncbi:Hypothetical protein NTJ_06272 [Nesidiocoris tenuis]|uniref:SXP/RAL-2 family protein Ani s 5-like cation-binding domain-containing protein n=1 Tax=Nesidiocoris tenuis TaxID=355587 RepID=A0ABN7AML0_9HEMI|nr:Hypothetical protein NTJ_06272 [Nesidiocoris tenuis]
MTSRTVLTICRLVSALLLVTAINGHPQLSRLLNSALQGRANQQQLQQQLLQQQLNQQLFGQQLSGRQQLNQLLGQQQLSQQQLNQQQLSQLLGQQQLSPQQLGQLFGQQQSNQLLGQQQSNQLLGSDDASADAALRCGRGGRGRGWGFNPFFGLGGLGGLGGFGGVPFRGGGFGRFRSSDVQQLLSAPMSLRQRIALQIRQQLQQVNQRLGQAGLQNEQMSDQFVSELVDKVGQGSPEEVQLYLKRLQSQLDKYNELATTDEEEGQSNQTSN